MKDQRDRANTQVDYGDYEDILNKYRNSISIATSPTTQKSTQLESILEEGFQESQQNFNLEQMLRDAEKCKSFSKNQDVGLVNQNDSIFKQVLSEQKLKELKKGKSECCICHKSSGVLSQLKQCKFCGNVICKEHGKKKRQEPNDQTRFRRICEICEDKYIRRCVEQAYLSKRNELSEQTLNLENESQKLISEIRQQQNKISEVQQNSVKKQGEHKEIQNELIFKIQKLENEIRTLEDESKIQKMQDDPLKLEVFQLKQKLEEKKQEAIKKQQQQYIIDQEIERIDKECQDVMGEIQKMQYSIQTNKQKEQKELLQQQSIKPNETQLYQQLMPQDDTSTIEQLIPKSENIQSQRDEEIKRDNDCCCVLM